VTGGGGGWKKGGELRIKIRGEREKRRKGNQEESKKQQIRVEEKKKRKKKENTRKGGFPGEDTGWVPPLSRKTFALEVRRGGKTKRGRT